MVRLMSVTQAVGREPKTPGTRSNHTASAHGSSGSSHTGGSNSPPVEPEPTTPGPDPLPLILASVRRDQHMRRDALALIGSLTGAILWITLVPGRLGAG